MTSERWPEVWAIFEQAVQYAAPSQAAFLDEACSGDVALRRVVEDLLAADQKVDHLVDHRLGWRGEDGDVPGNLQSFRDRSLVAGRYRIVRLLGRGGVGEVYHAQDLKLDEPVAVKLLDEVKARDEALLSRLLLEVKIARRITHPNVCRVYDVGEANGRHFLSMELIEGEDLASLLRRVGRPRRSEAMAILQQLCLGLDAVHREGILHCDLKPANLLIDGRGRVRITDFGIAAMAGTRMVAALRQGTPAYMAPEQYASAQVSFRADLYALGLVMYELLTGRRAFRGRSASELARLHRTASPTPPSQLVADFEPAVEEVILRCLEKDPADRPSSAQEVARVLSGRSPLLLTSGRRGFRALHQLPPPPPDFTGRETELDELREAAGLGGVTLICLKGMGGVGKTALALKLAEELAPLYPDAQIYLDLRGTSPEPLSAAEAMAHVLRAHCPEIPLPSREAELAARYRSVLHDRRVLLLMDNASGRTQVESLIPSPSSLLLLTSRRAFSLPGLNLRNLGTLPAEDAVGLLRRIVPRIGEHAAAIAQLCGYLPIALRLAGAALAERPDLAPSQYAQRLARGQFRLELIEASLDLSYGLLSTDHQRLWRALAVFPGTFDRKAAAAVWNLEDGREGDALGELVRSGLVEWADGRYRLHDLARLFAEDRLRADERLDFARRHGEHFLEILRKTAVLCAQGGDQLRDGLGLMDSEWGNIQAGQAWAEAHSEDDPRSARLCSEYPHACNHLLLLRLPASKQISWLETGMTSARRLNDLPAQRRHLTFLGRARASSGEARRGIALCEKALALARQIGDSGGECLTLSFLGWAHTLLGEQRFSVALFEEALTIAREIGDRHRECANLSYLGATLGNLGDRRRGIELLEQALVLARLSGDRLNESSILSGLGYLALGEPRRAIEFLEQALEIAREIGFHHCECNTLSNLVWAFLDLGEPYRAIELCEQAGDIAREVGSRRLEGHVLGDLGRAYLVLGEMDRTVDHLERSLAVAREVGDRFAESHYSWYLGLAYEGMGESDRAADLMQVRVDYERSLAHVEAEEHAARVDEIRSASAPRATVPRDGSNSPGARGGAPVTASLRG